MVGRDHQQSIRIFLNESQDGRDGRVKGDLIVNRRRRVIIMSGVIDAPPFHQQEETVRRILQTTQGRVGHLGKSRRMSGDGWIIKPIDFKRNMTLIKKPE